MFRSRLHDVMQRLDCREGSRSGSGTSDEQILLMCAFFIQLPDL